MDPTLQQLQQLQDTVNDLKGKWDSLTRSQAIPRDIETAFATRLGASINNQAFPVNSLYFSVDTTLRDPALVLGYGTWILYAKGQVPVGYKALDANFGTMGATGGEATHTLTVNELAAHSHFLNSGHTAAALDSGAGTAGFNAGGSGSINSVQNNGGGAAHNNLQPFVVVAIWQRTI